MTDANTNERRNDIRERYNPSEFNGRDSSFGTPMHSNGSSGDTTYHQVEPIKTENLISPASFQQGKSDPIPIGTNCNYCYTPTIDCPCNCEGCRSVWDYSNVNYNIPAQPQQPINPKYFYSSYQNKRDKQYVINKFKRYFKN